LPLQGLQAIDLPLHLAIAPASLHSSQDGREVFLKTRSQASQRTDSGMIGTDHPGSQGLAFPTLENVPELCGQLPQPQQVRALRGQLIQKCLLFGC
jgi:hypothetical protein